MGFQPEQIQRVCELFFEVPDGIEEPIGEDDWVRDTHYYAGGYLYNWLEYQRIILEAAFRPMPWYRQKEVCTRAVERVCDKVGPALRRKEACDAEDLTRVWHSFRVYVEEEAADEYAEFLEEVAWKGDFAE